MPALRVKHPMRWLTIIALLFSLIIPGSMYWIGERYWLTHLLLYMPALLWIAPFFLILIITLFLRMWRLAFFQGVCIFCFCIFYIDFFWTTKSKPIAAELTVVTNNIGQSKDYLNQNSKYKLEDFIEEENPTLIALQEVSINKENYYINRFADYHYRALGEFALLSKIPIVAMDFINLRGMIIGVWFQIDFNGQALMIYNIHLPSPRHHIKELSIKNAEGILSKQTRREFALSMRDRFLWAKELKSILKNEQRPFIALGDFNISSKGYLYSHFNRNFHDAFRRCGKGYGYTFPGDLPSPFLISAPWLRLDYIFSSKEIIPIYSRTERQRYTQHRAVSASFKLPFSIANDLSAN